MGIRVDPVPGAEWVQVAPTLWALSPQLVRGEDVEGGYDVEATVTALPFDGERAGRFVCQSLTVKQREGGPPVTNEAIRAIPVGWLVRGVGARAVMSEAPTTGDRIAVSDARVTEEMAERFRAQGPTAEVLAWVARVYRLALVLGDAPTKAVEETFGIPRSTAGRWVAAARASGHLAAAEGPGKVGG